MSARTIRHRTTGRILHGGRLECVLCSSCGGRGASQHGHPRWPIDGPSGMAFCPDCGGWGYVRISSPDVPDAAPDLPEVDH